MTKRILAAEKDIQFCITATLSFPLSRSICNALPICLDILSFNQLTDKVRRNKSAQSIKSFTLNCLITIKEQFVKSFGNNLVAPRMRAFLST